MYNPLILYGPFVSSLDILNFAVCPLPCIACLTIGESPAPKIAVLKTPFPNIAGLGIELNV